MWILAIVSLGVGAILWAIKAITPPPPKVCGSKNGPPVDSPRVRLSDGRHLAYKEVGVPKEIAKYKVIVLHGFDCSKDQHNYLPISQELIDELGIYIVTYDRAGYGESDPNPKRTVKSEAFDVQELADALELGPKFYVLGPSVGTYTIWGCLKYIPHRLAGVSLLVPITNYWWPSFPRELCDIEYKKQAKKDQLNWWIIHNAPWLVYWYMTQKWFRPCSYTGKDPIFDKCDISILEKMSKVHNPTGYKTRQQGVYESLCRDLIVMFGNWEFDPMELKNPFADNEGAVQLWQGCKDTMVSLQLQRFLAKKLPWIKYYEVPNAGHMILHDPDLCNSIIKALLLKEDPTSF